MTDRELDEMAYGESLDEPLDTRMLAESVQREERMKEIIEDIKGIVAVLDPKGYKWAEQTKKEREGRQNGRKA